jgi:Metalloenzyme superfamily
VHSTLRRFAALLVLAGPLALSGATSGAARVRPAPPREARTLTTAAPATSVASEERAESAVVLVVLDGVRWQEVFNGPDRELLRQRGMSALAETDPRDLMPNLHRLIDGEGLAIGAPGRGAEITATGPQFISLPGYIEIFAGRPDPGCHRNDCAPSPARTILDQVRGSSGADDVALVASWPNIARAASSEPGFALTAGRKLVDREDVLRADDATARLLDQGARAAAWPGEGDYRPDAITARIALRRLAVSRPRFLFVGLGDADEHGHRNDYRAYLDAVRASDAFLGDLVATLRSMGARGRHTTILVTADHGRARDFADHGAQFPESGRVWLVAAGADVRSRGLVSAARRHTLSDLAPTIRALLGISEGDAPPIPEIAVASSVALWGEQNSPEHPM